jgi:bla regulator protein BlaR1
MIVYLIKSTFCLAAVLGIYHLLLERESLHRFKRFFLLGGLGFSFLIPLITIGHTEYIRDSNTSGRYLLEVISSDAVAPSVLPQYAASFVFSVVYLLIATALLLRFTIQVVGLIRKARRHRNISFKNATLVLVNEQIVPYTFCHYIFIDKADYLNNVIESELLTHELTHVRQVHSLDILIVELFRVMFWFNPVLPFLKRAIQANHEYLADKEVIETHQHISQYQRLLLDKVSGNTRIHLASNFTYRLTKKRLKMMTKSTEKMRAQFFISATLPLMAALVLLFGKTTMAQKESTTQTEEISTANDTYFKDAIFVWSDGDEMKVYTPYKALSEAEKSKIPPLPPLTLRKDGSALSPLAKGTVVQVTEEGQVKILKDKTVPAPPPPPSPPSKRK